MTPWSLALSAGWVAHVNKPQTELELAAVRRSVLRGSPLGEESWRLATAKKLGLLSTLRPRGRPRVADPG
jgi:putative transposase